MSICTLIIGPPGAGKSTSLRNLDPAHTLLIQTIKKALPFRRAGWSYFDRESNKAGNIFVADTSDVILKIARATRRKVIVIDDWNVMLTNQFMRRSDEKGFDKFNDIGRAGWDLLNGISALPDDVTVYLLGHTQTDEFGHEKAKTIGRMIDEKFPVESYFATVLKAQRTGRGDVIDCAMTDGSALLMSMIWGFRRTLGWRDQRGVNLLDGGAPFYRCYACRDGGFVAVAALEPRFYAALLAGLALDPAEAPQHDVAAWPALAARFEALFLERDRDDWAARFAGTEACVTPVLSLAEAALHPHNRARGTFHDGLPAPAPRFDGARPAPPGAGVGLSLDEAVAQWSVPG